MHPLRWKGLIKKKLWKSKPIVDRSDFLKDEIIVDFFGLILWKVGSRGGTTSGLWSHLKIHHSNIKVGFEILKGKD